VQQQTKNDWFNSNDSRKKGINLSWREAELEILFKQKTHLVFCGAEVRVLE
jgi:hypothetical protein